MDEESVLDFLTSLEAMDLPDRIEEVNSKILSKIIEDTDYVAVLFCKYRRVFFWVLFYVYCISYHVVNRSKISQLTINSALSADLLILLELYVIELHFRLIKLTAIVILRNC